MIKDKFNSRLMRRQRFLSCKLTMVRLEVIQIISINSETSAFRKILRLTTEIFGDGHVSRKKKISFAETNT